MKIMMNSGRILPFLTMRKRLLQSVMGEGHEITLSGFQPEYADECHEFGVDFVEVPLSRAGLNPFQDLKVLKLYKQIMKDNHFDVIHSYTIKPNIYGSIAAKRSGIQKIYPTINGLGYSFTDEGRSDLKSKLVRTVVKTLYRKAFSCATKVFFQNSDDADEMVRLGLIPRDKCVIISGSGIDLLEFPYSEPSLEPMSFLLATRLLITKGVRTYFEAARIVKGRYPQAIFQIAGGLDPNPDGIKKEELDAYINDGTIMYLGHVDDMPRALAASSVFVLPSFYREGIPHAILEAMSTGRAIITCNSPGCRETVKEADEHGEGKNGFLIEPKNSQMLAEKMIWMIEHPDEVALMGRESRKYAEERFDVEKVNKIMLETMGLK